MLPVLKGISDKPKYQENPNIKRFKPEIDMIEKQISQGTAIGMEDGPNIEASILTTQNIIEEMFQEIVTTDISTEDAAKKAEERSEEHTSELQSRFDIVCRLLLEKKTSRRALTGGVPWRRLVRPAVSLSSVRHRAGGRGGESEPMDEVRQAEGRPARLAVRQLGAV